MNEQYDYPPEWDLPEQEMKEVWMYSHEDLGETDNCSGAFHARQLRLPTGKTETFFCCDECGLWITEEELQALAVKVYGHDWQKFCRFYIPVDSVDKLSWADELPEENLDREAVASENSWAAARGI